MKYMYIFPFGAVAQIDSILPACKLGHYGQGVCVGGGGGGSVYNIILLAIRLQVL